MNADLVAGRRALSRARRALAPHADALILVGAHAVQVWAGHIDAQIGGSPMSMDADLQVDTVALRADPTLEAAMQGAHFRLARDGQGNEQPGIWVSEAGVRVDLLVAEAQAHGTGSRAARVDARDPKSARRVRGLEVCLYFNATRPIGALDAGEKDEIEIRVARPAALLVAKAYKLGERFEDQGRRVRGKDALDVLRLLLAEEAGSARREMNETLGHPECGAVARVGVDYLGTLFGGRNSRGCALLRDEYGEQGEVYAAQVHELMREVLPGPGVV
jgi:hypothetical protein